MIDEDLHQIGYLEKYLVLPCGASMNGKNARSLSALEIGSGRINLTCVLPLINCVDKPFVEIYIVSIQEKGELRMRVIRNISITVFVQILCVLCFADIEENEGFLFQEIKETKNEIKSEPLGWGGGAGVYFNAIYHPDTSEVRLDQMSVGEGRFSLFRARPYSRFGIGTALFDAYNFGIEGYTLVSALPIYFTFIPYMKIKKICVLPVDVIEKTPDYIKFKYTEEEERLVGDFIIYIRIGGSAWATNELDRKRDANTLFGKRQYIKTEVMIEKAFRLTSCPSSFIEFFTLGIKAGILYTKNIGYEENKKFYYVGVYLGAASYLELNKSSKKKQQK